MPDKYVTVSAIKRSIAFTVTAVMNAIVFAACAPPLAHNLGASPHVSRNVLSAAQTAATAEVVEQADTGEPVVLVRYYAHSPTVTVIAWDPGRAAYGLRATIRRDGTLVQHHQLYVSTFHFVVPRAFGRAQWNFSAPNRKAPHRLLYQGIAADFQSCESEDGDVGCSPFITLRAMITDGVLRASSDEVTVDILGRDNNDLTLTLSRELITAYLKKVDAVSASIIAN